MNTTDHKTTYWLEMNSEAAFRPSATDSRLQVCHVELPCPEFNWFLHQAVGGHYRWGGREAWGAAEWQEFVDRTEVETHVGYIRSTPAGYFELEKQDDQSIRVLCFGLLPQFIGQGLGGPLLTEAVSRCWQLGATRIWLTTCSHDHPHALSNYLARGFRQFDQTQSALNAARSSGLFARTEPLP